MERNVGAGATAAKLRRFQSRTALGHLLAFSRFCFTKKTLLLSLGRLC